MNKQAYKTRTQFAAELGFSRRTLYTKLKNEDITLKKGDICPQDQKYIRKKLGFL